MGTLGGLSEAEARIAELEAALAAAEAEGGGAMTTDPSALTPEQVRLFREHIGRGHGLNLGNAKTLLAAYDAQAARLAAVEAERDHAIANLVQVHDRWGAEEQHTARLAAVEQQLQDWQDHLGRVHRVACDYPFHTDLPEDYTDAADG